MNKKTLVLEIRLKAEMTDENTIRVNKTDANAFGTFLQQLGVSATYKSAVGKPYDEFIFEPNGQAAYIFNSWQ